MVIVPRLTGTQVPFCVATHVPAVKHDEFAFGVGGGEEVRSEDFQT